jgi:superfamily I DNA and/or RNA helicase
LASARNAVIVGDPKQLPHIVPDKLKGPLDEIRKRYNFPAFIDYKRFSILESILEEFGNAVSKCTTERAL